MTAVLFIYSISYKDTTHQDQESKHHNFFRPGLPVESVKHVQIVHKTVGETPSC